MGLSSTARRSCFQTWQTSFTLSKATGSQNLSVVGGGRYGGFTLFVSGDRQFWYCAVGDGLAHSATDGAKKLAQLMENKFGIKDMKSLWDGPGSDPSL